MNLMRHWLLYVYLFIAYGTHTLLFCGFRCKIEMRQKKKKNNGQSMGPPLQLVLALKNSAFFLAIFLEVYRKPFLVFFL